MTRNALVSSTRPLFPEGGPGAREVTPALLQTAVLTGIGTAVIVWGVLPPGQCLLLAVLAAVATFALFLDLVVTRLNQRVPSVPRLLGRVALAGGVPLAAAVLTFGSTWWVLRVAVLAGSGLWFLRGGAKELRARLRTGAVNAGSGLTARTVAWRVRRMLRSADGDTRRWLQVNLVRALLVRGELHRDPPALAESRAMALDLMDPRSLAGASPEQLDQIGLTCMDVGRALDEAGLGTPGAGGDMLDELIAWGNERYPHGAPAPHALLSRLRYVEAERELARLTQAALQADTVTAAGMGGARERTFSRALDLARESLRLAPADLRPEPLAVIAGARYFLVQHSTDAAEWTSLLAETRAALEEIPPGDMHRNAVLTVEASVLSGLAATEPRSEDRRQRLDDAQSALEGALAARPPPPADDRLNLVVELAGVHLARASETGEALEAERGVQTLLQAARDARTWLEAGRLAMRVSGATRGLLHDDVGDTTGGPPGGWPDRWRRYGAEGCRLTVDAMLAVAVEGAVRAEMQGPLGMLSSATALGAEFLCELGEPFEAAVLLERGRLVAMSASLQAQAVDDGLRRDGKVDLADDLIAARARLQEIEWQLERRPQEQAALATEAFRRRRDLTAMTDRARRITGVGAGEDVAEWITRASSHVPLLYLTAGDDCGYAVLLRETGPPVSVPLPRLLVLDVDEDVDVDDVRPEDYTGLEARALRFRQAQNSIGDGTSTWNRTLEETLEWLWDVVGGPLEELLAGIGEVALVPCGPLAQLPVHAALGVRAGGTAPVVRYAAGARALAERSANVDRAGAANAVRLLTVAVPVALPGDGPAVSDLRSACAQAEAAAGAFPEARVTQLTMDAATRAAVTAALPGQSVVHFSCHGTADADDPLDGGLLLRDGRLRLREILPLPLESVRLAVISACEGSMNDPFLHDELNSLATGLIEAGVAGVVTTMWQVPERASYYLCVRFYEELGRTWPHSPASAFARAQAWLRTATLSELARYPPPPGRRVRTTTSDPALLDLPAFPEADSWACFAYHGV